MSRLLRCLPTPRARQPIETEAHKESRHARDGLTAPDRVFTKPTGQVWDYDSFANRFDALRAKMTLPEINARPFTFHSTRHTYASWALMANRPVIWVSKVLGHADIKTTLETYAHVIPDMAPDLSFLGALETQNGGDSERVIKFMTFYDTTTQSSVSPIPQAIGSKGETWSGRRDLNPRPLDPQSSALPDCATARTGAWFSPGAADRRCRKPRKRLGGSTAGTRQGPAGNRGPPTSDARSRTAGPLPRVPQRAPASCFTQSGFA